MHAASARPEECGMPAEQPLRGERAVVALRGVEHHLDHAVDVPVGGLQPPHVQPEPAGHRRADLIRVEQLTLNLAALQHVVSERAQHRFVPSLQAERLHLTRQTTLQVPRSRERAGEILIVPAEPWPVGQLVDVAAHSTLKMR